MYTLRIEERGQRRVSSMVPRGGNNSPSAAADEACPSTSQQATPSAAAAPAGAAATPGAAQPSSSSLYDEVFRAPLPDGASSVEFSAGNPRVEHINGLVHLYRRRSPEADGPAAAAATAEAAAAEEDLAATSKTVCCLAIPSDMAVASFCSFIGAYLEHARELRVLRREGLGGGGGGAGDTNGGNNATPTTTNCVCMVLVEFDEQSHADDFYADYNGRPFSALEPEILCRLVYVREVEVIEAGRRGLRGGGGGGAGGDGEKAGGDDDGDGGKAPAAGGDSGSKANKASTKSKAKAAAPPGPKLPTPPASFLPAPPGHTELPSCPVCLERLDERATGGGIVTTVCNHQFHSDCLQRWGDTSCPVCRYCAGGGGGGRGGREGTTGCEACGERRDTWLCLICGSAGCGRYTEGQHAVRHWRETGHSYALELATQRVWCYASDCFVHRLIMSKVDGKLVELPSPAAGGRRGGGPGGGNGGGGNGGGGPAGCGGGNLAFGALPPAGSCGDDGAAGGSGVGGGGYCGGPEGRPLHPAACAHHRRRRSTHAQGGGGGGEGEGAESAAAFPGPCGACPECRSDEHVKEALVASKLDALSLEYTHLLTTQLESQRLFFESRLAAAESDAARAIATAGDEADDARRRAEVSDAAAREAEKRRAASDRRAEQAIAAAQRAEEERGFLKSLNETLLQNARDVKAREAAAADKLRAAEARAADLEEQVRDLMVAFEARSLVERAGGELEGATLLPVQQSELERRRAARDRKKGGKGGGG
jgi:BRCA1-associated protein